MDWSSVVARALPSVVNISVETLIDKNGVKQRQRAVGTGFLVDSSGMIATNKHVIVGAFRIVVTMHDGSRWLAKLVAAAKMIDLAVIKIDTGHPLPFLKFAGRDAAKIGEPVLVIGNPLGLGTSVSAGIISALHRNLMNTPFDDYVQTDASINHGNSGGPMIDSEGKVLGISTILVTNGAGEGSNGLGFAISAWTASYVVNHLIHPNGSTVGWSGLHLQDATSALQRAFHLPVLGGALITQVDPDSPASKAGLRAGDVILRVDDMVPSNSRELLLDFIVTRVGSVVPLEVDRQGKIIKTTITIEDWPGLNMAERTMTNTMADAEAAQPPDMGLILAPMTDAARRLFKFKAKHGAIVAAVDPTSEAFTDGIVVGDVIEQVQGTPVDTPGQVMQIIDRLQAKQSFVALLVQDKDGANRWVALYASQMVNTSEAPAGVAAVRHSPGPHSSEPAAMREP